MVAFTIYHNPRCSKSRATLALLQERGVEPHVVEYLNTPPSVTELKKILSYLGMKPQQLIRKNEEIYRSAYADKTLTDAQWIDVMVAHPVLIERPIVVSGNKAALGRPPENALSLLK